jgi:protein SCO1/2
MVTNTDLLGHVWIANFIYTRCATECPLMSNQMARFQEALAAERDVRFVSVTVDPEYDTPEVLTRYAQSFAAQPQRWLFLTGDKTATYRLVREGFRLGVMEPSETGRSSALPASRILARRLGGMFMPALAYAHHGAHPGEPLPQTIIHSGRFVLVDRQGQIRHYYDSTDVEALQRVPRDVRRVLQER